MDPRPLLPAKRAEYRFFFGAMRRLERDLRREVRAGRPIATMGKVQAAEDRAPRRTRGPESRDALAQGAEDDDGRPAFGDGVALRAGRDRRFPARGGKGLGGDDPAR